MKKKIGYAWIACVLLFLYAPIGMMIAIAKERGCRFIFGTDCHWMDAQRVILSAPIVADALGLTEEDLHPIVRE